MISVDLTNISNIISSKFRCYAYYCSLPDDLSLGRQLLSRATLSVKQMLDMINILQRNFMKSLLKCICGKFDGLTP